MNSNNWCELCEEACNDHPTICSVCGTSLTACPSGAATSTSTATTSNEIDRGDMHEQLLNDMQQASRDLRNILGNLRGQVQDLDVLTRNILRDGENGNNNLPREVWDPQHATSGPAFRPTSADALKKIPRFVLNDQSTIFRQATLQVYPSNNVTTPSCLLSITPAASESQAIPHATSSVTSAARTNGTATVRNNALKFDCVLGEFGPTGEYAFGMEGTSLVLASPVTGKGGLDSATKSRISRLKNKKVVVFMQRGDGLTYVQKARMAQDAGAAAVIIGNNTPSPWPYVMKDLKGESKRPGQSISIPVAMIKEVDGREIIRIVETQKKTVLERERKRQAQPPIPQQIVVANEKQLQEQSHRSESRKEPQPEESQDGDNSFAHQPLLHFSCELTITEQSCDCPVCCEQLQNSETVVQLPGCGHVFHEACAMVWLKSHNTCPYCRRELATDDPEYERERRQRQQRQQHRTAAQSHGSGGGETASHNGASFYG